MFNKKSSPSTNTTSSGTTNNQKIVIHAMPSKFLPLRKKAKSYDFLFFIFIFLIVIGGGIFIFSDYIFIPSVKEKFLGKMVAFFHSEVNISETRENNNPVVSSGHSSLPQATTTKSSLSSPSSQKSEIPSKKNPASTSTPLVSFPSSPKDIVVVPPASDRDNDTLTDEEERIFKTNYLDPDTDKDGFLDGQEIANLYNPLQGNSALLKSTDLVEIYRDVNYNYSLLYPKGWKVIPLPNSTRDITFVSPQKEFIEVSIMDNPEGLTAAQWYLKQIPSSLVYKTERVWANNFVGIKTVDGMTVYLTPIRGARNFIYSISYMVGDHTYITYPTVFQMMVRSFDVSY